MTKTVLLVEDNPDDIFFMQRALSKAGVTCMLKVAEDGQQAVDYVSGMGRFADRLEWPLPDLVLLDLKLPCLNGLEVLSWIRRNSPRRYLPVLILTSSRERRDIEQAFSRGANSYMVKPQEAEDLVDLLRSVCHFWLRHHQGIADA